MFRHILFVTKAVYNSAYIFFVLLLKNSEYQLLL